MRTLAPQVRERKMTKRLLVMICGLQVATMVSVGALWLKLQSDANGDPASTHQPCYFRGGQDSTCIASFASVLARPEEFQGKRVILVGYFALRYGVPMLYASKDDYLNDVSTSAIAIVGSYEELANLFREHGDSYVRLEATFRLPGSSKNVAWAGELTPGFRASTPEPLPRQGIEDLLVPVE